MKKILMTLALVASLQIAFAQPGGQPGGQFGPRPGGAPQMSAQPGSKVLAQKREAAKAAIQTAEEAANNAKKATKLATWMTLAKAYVQADAAAAGDAWIGATKDELALVLGGRLNPMSSETVTIDGQTFTKENYNGCDFYFSPNGALAMTVNNVEVVSGALDKAVEAYKKAAELDPKGTKTKDISAALKNIAQSYVDNAYSYYQLKDFAKASEFFEKAAKTSEIAPLSESDYSFYYNAGFTAFLGENMGRAKSLLNKCLENGYEHEDGAIYSYLAKIADSEGDKEGSLAFLEKGFTKYPSSQSILIELINYYVTSGTNTDKLFSLLDEAKKNEPNNASLYYVEGNIDIQLGKEEDALAAYDKCASVDPNYEFGYYGKGIYYYNKAVDLQDAASTELDNAKYMVLAEQFEAALTNCVAPFEKAFEITKRDDVKQSSAEYLRNATFRLREKGQEYQAAYDKYNAFVKGE